MHGENISYAYGFWNLVAINVALFAFFLLSFLTPFKVGGKSGHKLIE